MGLRTDTSWHMGLAGLALGVMMTLTVNVMADGDPTTDDVPRTLPYQGILEIDGEPVDATGGNALHIMFELYDGQASEAPVYRQSQPVEVYAGRFTTTIGPLGVNAEGDEVIISDLIANADDLYLGMVLLGDLENPDDDVALANRQRIHASPYAMWSTTATNFVVANTLTVGGSTHIAGDANVSGEVNAASITTEGPLSADTVNADTLDLTGTLGVAGGATVNGALNSGTLDTGALTASSVSASGAISGNFQLSVSNATNASRDASGEDIKNLGSTSRRFCYLTKAAYKDIEGGSEQAECRIDTANGQWRLRAIVISSSDANAICSARCVSW